jgi:hypothetical protein
MKKVLFIMLLAIGSNIQTALAQTPGIIANDKTGWKEIGKTVVDFTSDRDAIMVMGYNRFTMIKFKVSEAPIELLDLEIYYSEGEKEDIKINSTVKAEGESRLIDLNGNRKVTKIVFVYKTIPNYKGKKARVEIWGLNTNDDKLK